MLRSFWFYFNTIPVLLGIFALYKLNSFPPRGSFKDALVYCKNVDNERMLSEGTEQDYCIDNFMTDYFNETVPWMLLFLLGVVFIIPLCFYLIMSWRKYRYSN
jgi:hypothetical protein